MSLKNKLFSGVALATAVFAFSAVGFGQEATTTSTDSVEKVKGEHRGHGKRGFGRGDMDGKRHGKRGMGGRGHGMLRGLDLSEAQKTQLKAIHEANKPSQEVREEMKTLRMAKKAGTITADQQLRIDTLKAQAKEKHQAVKAQIDAILTPEQKAQIETKKAEMKVRRQERRQQRELRKAAAPADKPKVN